MGILNKKENLKKIRNIGIALSVLGGVVFSIYSVKMAENDARKETLRQDVTQIATTYADEYNDAELNNNTDVNFRLEHLQSNSSVSENVKNYVKAKQEALSKSQTAALNSNVGVLAGMFTATLGLAACGTVALQPTDNKEDEEELER